MDPLILARTRAQLILSPPIPQRPADRAAPDLAGSWPRAVIYPAGLLIPPQAEDIIVAYYREGLSLVARTVNLAMWAAV